MLQHDLFEITVDLARGYTIPAALAFQPSISVSISFRRLLCTTNAVSYTVEGDWVLPGLACHRSLSRVDDEHHVPLPELYHFCIGQRRQWCDRHPEQLDRFWRG